MSQKVIIAILAIIILAGGGAWYYQNNMSGSDSAFGGRIGGDDKKEDTGGMLDMLKEGTENITDVMKSGKASQCKFAGTDPETGEYTEGMVYVSGESYNLEADTVIDGQDVKIYMIEHEGVMYMWSDDAEAMPGMKIDARMFANMDDSEEKPESPIDWLRDPEYGMKLSCKGWSPKRDSFEPPEDVEFFDMFGGMGQAFGAMMQEMGSAMEDTGTPEDSYGDQYTDEYSY